MRPIGFEQLRYARSKVAGRHSAWQACPLPLAKPVWHASCIFGGVVDHHRKQKRLILSHVKHAAYRKIPFAPKVAFTARLGIGGDERHEQRTVLDLLADRRVPGVPTAHITLS